MDIKTIGIDIGKNKFHVHGVNEKGKILVRTAMTRQKLYEFMANLKPCLVGMEACGGAHHLARTLKEYGHDARLMAIQHVKPYVKEYKNDFNDAAGICEAVTRPHMKFVGIKTNAQQNIMAIHNDRARLVEERTALANEIRGILLEEGLPIAQGIHHLVPRITELLDPASEEISHALKRLLASMVDDFKHKGNLIQERETLLKELTKNNSQAQNLMTIPGIGFITATAIVGKVGNVNVFENGRQLAAWLGLVPKQYSTGGKVQLGRISKRGDRTLRALLVHGARSVLRAIKLKKEEDLSPPLKWLKSVAERRGHNKGIVAFANKMARVIWAVLANDTVYQADYKRSCRQQQLAA
jgi:transposase